jgi:hypothetical protein
MLGSNPLSSMIRKRTSGPLFGQQSDTRMKLSKDIREAEGFDELPMTFMVEAKDAFHNKD